MKKIVNEITGVVFEMKSRSLYRSIIADEVAKARWYGNRVKCEFSHGTCRIKEA